MATSLTTSRCHELIDRPVLDSYTVEELGHVSQLYIDLKAQHVAFFICDQGGGWHSDRVIDWEDIDALEPDAIFVTCKPARTQWRKNDIADVIGYELWSDSGNQIGEIRDYILNLKTGQILEYLFVYKGWQGLGGRLYRLPVGALINVSLRRVLADAQAIQTAEAMANRLGIVSSGSSLLNDQTSDSQFMGNNSCNVDPSYFCMLLK